MSEPAVYGGAKVGVRAYKIGMMYTRQDIKNGYVFPTIVHNFKVLR